MTKMLQVLLAPGIGGMETAVASLSEALGQMGVDCESVFLDGETPETWRTVRRCALLTRSRRAVRPDVIVAHSTIPALLTAISTPPGTPIVFVAHSSGDDFRFPKLRLAAKVVQARFDRVVLVSEAAREPIGRHLPRLARRGVVIPNAVNIPDVQREPSGAARRLLFVGRLIPMKRCELVLRAFAQVLQRNPDLELAVVGDGAAEYVHALKDLASSLATGHRVHFLGAMSPRDVYKEMMRADLLVHASDREAQGLVLFEALSLGLPVLANHSLATVIPNSGGIRLFPPTETGLCREMERALLEFGTLEAEALHSASAVREDVSPQPIAARYRSMLEDLLRTHGRD